MASRRPEGVRVRHSRGCPSRTGGACRTAHTAACAARDRLPCDCGCCSPAYEAFVWLPHERVKIRRTFARLDEAKSWRTDALKAAKDGKLGRPSKLTVQEAAEDLLARMKDGRALTRSGNRYKPSVIRGQERLLKRHVFPELGHVRLVNLRRRDVQDLVDELVAAGLSGSTVRNVVMPLRVICRRAIEDDQLAVNPTANLRLPQGAGRRERVATAEEAAELLDALPAADRALWATAFYAGLRRGELRGLRWEDVDEACGVIRVCRGWDDVEGAIEPKSQKGTREVPLVGTLRLILLEHKARTGRRAADLVFGRTASESFTPNNIAKRAAKAWAAANIERQEQNKPPLTPIGLHELRHSFVSMMHDAGFSLERIGDYVGHSSTYMTDRYRHLLEGHEQEAADILDAYLARRGARTGAHLAIVARQPALLSQNSPT
jgi:integrase